MLLGIYFYAHIHEKRVRTFLRIGSRSLLASVLKINALMMFCEVIFLIYTKNGEIIKYYNIGFKIFLVLGMLLVVEDLISGKR